MKDAEDEAFDEIAKKQGHWGGGYQAKRQMAKARIEDDDDTQVYKRPWVGLTDEEIKEIVGTWGDTPIKGYTRKLFDQIEAKLRSKNNG